MAPGEAANELIGGNSPGDGMEYFPAFDAATGRGANELNGGNSAGEGKESCLDEAMAPIEAKELAGGNSSGEGKEYLSSLDAAT